MDKKKQEPQVQAAFRVPRSFLERVDRVAERMSRPGLRLIRTDVLRMASFKGLELLEAENSRRK